MKLTFFKHIFIFIFFANLSCAEEFNLDDLGSAVGYMHGNLMAFEVIENKFPSLRGKLGDLRTKYDQSLISKPGYEGGLKELALNYPDEYPAFVEMLERSTIDTNKALITAPEFNIQTARIMMSELERIIKGDIKPKYKPILEELAGKHRQNILPKAATASHSLELPIGFRSVELECGLSLSIHDNWKRMTPAFRKSMDAFARELNENTKMKMVYQARSSDVAVVVSVMNLSPDGNIINQEWLVNNEKEALLLFESVYEEDLKMLTSMGEKVRQKYPAYITNINNANWVRLIASVDSLHNQKRIKKSYYYVDGNICINVMCSYNNESDRVNEYVEVLTNSLVVQP